MTHPPIILIHGAWHGAWCWYRVVPLLAAAGRRVVALDMPGRAGDTRAHADITLDDFVDHVEAALDMLGEPAILVGHSLGGMSITMTAERVPERVAGLVYVTALLPQTGQSTWDLVRSDAESLTPGGLVLSEDGHSSTLDPEVMVPGFYHDCGSEDIALARTNLVPEVRKISLTPAQTTPERFGTVPRFYVQCTEDRAVTLKVQQAMIAAQPCEKVFRMTCSHSPFFAAPEELAEHLLSV